MQIACSRRFSKISELIKLKSFTRVTFKKSKISFGYNKHLKLFKKVFYFSQILFNNVSNCLEILNQPTILYLVDYRSARYRWMLWASLRRRRTAIVEPPRC